jgi:hypothetical protein
MFPLSIVFPRSFLLQTSTANTPSSIHTTTVETKMLEESVAPQPGEAAKQSEAKARKPAKIRRQEKKAGKARKER